jgi:hypothetical protein
MSIYELAMRMLGSDSRKLLGLITASFCPTPKWLTRLKLCAWRTCCYRSLTVFCFEPQSGLLYHRQLVQVFFVLTLDQLDSRPPWAHKNH